MTLTVTQALVLGAIHGPAELLPVSSSAHVQLVPRLLGWDHDALPADTRKAFDRKRGQALREDAAMRRDAVVGLAVPCRELHDRKVWGKEFQ